MVTLKSGPTRCVVRPSALATPVTVRLNHVRLMAARYRRPDPGRLHKAVFKCRQEQPPPAALAVEDEVFTNEKHMIQSERFDALAYLRGLGLLQETRLVEMAETRREDQSSRATLEEIFGVLDAKTMVEFADSCLDGRLEINGVDEQLLETGGVDNKSCFTAKADVDSGVEYVQILDVVEVLVRHHPRLVEWRSSYLRHDAF